ncbi:MAG: hypothetical protein ACJ73S_02630 [Mycobacteriales bacterium]
MGPADPYAPPAGAVAEPGPAGRRVVTVAVAAVGALVLAVGAAVLGAVAFDRHHHGPRVTHDGQRPLAGLPAGTCLDLPQPGAVLVGVHDCGSPHDAELLGAGPAPDPAAGPTAADDTCAQREAAAFTDTELARAPTLQVVALAAPDGTVRCALHDTGGPYRGSLRQRLQATPQLPGSLSWRPAAALQPGECFNTSPAGEVPATVGVLACALPHDAQVVRRDLVAAYTPALATTALVACGTSLPPGGGTPVRPAARTPTAGQFATGDHTVVCVATTAHRRTGPL